MNKRERLSSTEAEAEYHRAVANFKTQLRDLRHALGVLGAELRAAAPVFGAVLLVLIALAWLALR